MQVICDGGLVQSLSCARHPGTERQLLFAKTYALFLFVPVRKGLALEVTLTAANISGIMKNLFIIFSFVFDIFGT